MTEKCENCGFPSLYSPCEACEEQFGLFDDDLDNWEHNQGEWQK